MFCLANLDPSFIIFLLFYLEMDIACIHSEIAQNHI